MLLEGQKVFYQFPAVDQANEDGILAMGGDLGVDWLLSAYCQGVFPWFNDDQPILWWSPDPRFILYPHEAHLPSRLKRKIFSGQFTVRADSCFEKVIEACARVKRPDQPGTWITSDIMAAYVNLHKAGWAHSIEVFWQDELCGGLYGVQIGGAFFGESMFFLKPDASKTALAALIALSKAKKWDFIDSQVETAHMLNYGARNIARSDYIAGLKKSLETPSAPGLWSEIILFDLLPLAFYNDGWGGN